MFFGIPLALFVVCPIVVLGRIVDMSLSTIRTVYTVKGKPQIAGPIGFVEAFFWFMIVKAALDFKMTNPAVDTLCLAIAYSLGFALGTYIGGKISQKFVKSTIHVQIVLSAKNDEIVSALSEKGFGQTIITAKGAKKNAETYMIFIETDSKQLTDLRTIIHSMDEKAFVSVSESKSVFNGFFGTNARK